MPRERLGSITAVRLEIDRELKDRIDSDRGSEAVVQWAIHAFEAALANPEELQRFHPMPKNAVSFFLELPSGLLASIDQTAGRLGMRRTCLMRVALSAYLDRPAAVNS